MMTRSSDARHVRRILFLVSLIALLVFFEPSSRAQTTSITQVFSRAALGGNDFIDWGQLPQPFQTLANSFSVTSQQGQMAQIKNVGPSILFSDQQGKPWMGNFAPGDFLLGAGTSFEIVFSQPIHGLGAQLGYDLCNCPFVAHLVLFDSSHNVLASLTAPGLESSAADNSAVFIGAMDSVAEIKSAQFFANSATLNVDTFTINRMSLTTAGCQVDLTTKWSQGVSPQFTGNGPPGGGPWGDQTYDDYNSAGGACIVGDASTNCKIRKLGCALTALAMALRFQGKEIDPGTLNDFMRQQNLFDENHDVMFDATANKFGLKLNTGSSGSSQSSAELRQLVCRGAPTKAPVIVGVDLTRDVATGQLVPQHYVLVTGVSGEQFQIVDPGDHANTILDPTDFLIRGSVGDPPGDISRLNLAVGNNVEVLIEDESNRRTGFDITARAVFEEIPNSVHFIDSLRDDETGLLGATNSHSVRIFQPTGGIFRLVLTGLHLGTYALSVRAISSDGTAQRPVEMRGIANVGSTSTYQIQFSSVPGAALNVVRSATFDSTLSDINNSVQLGLIDNAGVANSLSSKIQAAAAASADGQTQASKNILNAFKNEVTALSGQHIIGIAPQVLLQDADSLLH